MAKAEEAADEAPKAKGGSKLILILMIVIIVLLLVAIGIGAMFLLKKPAADASHAAATTEQSAQGQKADGDEKHGAPITVSLGQPITVNLAEPNDAKLLQVELDLITYDHDAEAIVKTNRAEIINNIMLVLSDVNATKLRTREGKEDLQRQLKDAVNAVLEKRSGKKDMIDDVYFTKLLMQ
ncbi:MAG: flagellar basal body-associated FliL family protein [Halothiobacillus sp.]|nr:flagellar basal body-associated FliL family protein [Halothiobacillus sp.]